MSVGGSAGRPGRTRNREETTVKRFSSRLLAFAVIASLLVGGVTGFFLGIGSTKIGKQFLEDMVEDEQQADVSNPSKVQREKFEIQYPSNWKVDTEDEDYDADTMFSIDSPGSTFVMFVIMPGLVDPDEMVQIQIEQFRKLVSTMSVTKLERYGSHTGKGAKLTGKTLGISTTTRVFSFKQDNMTIMITEQCPDDDRPLAQAGLKLIEKSFKLKARKK
jgi:hypothetical protein